VPDTALPDTALPVTALPVTALPVTALPDIALPGITPAPVALTPDLTDRVALVTGASGALGARAAQAMHAAGAHVIAAGRSRDRLADVARLDRVTIEVCDLTDEQATAAMVQRSREKFGRIDVLINNAGISEPGSAQTEATESFRRVLETNVVAAFTLSRQVGQLMLDRGAGSIINVGSVFGVKGVADAPTGYAVSKAAIHGLTLQLAAQWARRGVRVNAIAPGPFASGLNDYFRDPQEAQFWGGRTALGRVAAAGEMDGILLYLASDQSAYVTGQVISVDGGWSAV
jgi:NAD(P)-dependent dehydrogenase (short-subunit alcohol dehydrogenase family)